VIAHRQTAAPRETRDLAPLAVAFPGASLSMGSPRYPEGASATAPGSSVPVLGHSGEAAVVVPVSVASDAAAGERRLRLRVVFQVCDARRCEAPDNVLLEAPVVVERP
jgi:hypothetical protein